MQPEGTGGSKETGRNVSVFGFDITLEFVLKFAGLIFALGMIFQRFTSLEEKVMTQINNQGAILQHKMDALDWRLRQVEGTVNREALK